jgi:cysteine-rich repeat protein
MVEVVDLVTGLRIALGDDPLAVCTAWDANGDGDVTIDELMLGVDEALNGCPPAISEPPRCGDHVITGQEQCDDGNTVGGDGCSASCTVEGPGPVDQIWNGCTGSGGGININYAAPVGQEFVPDGATLSGVAVRVTTQFDEPAGSANLSARIHTATIDGAVVAEGTDTVTGDGAYLFVFDAPAAVTPGATLVLELATDSQALSWERGGATAECTYSQGRPVYFGVPLSPDDMEDLFFIAFGAS